MFILIAIIVVVPVFIFTLEVLFALLPLRKKNVSDIESQAAITVLIPAHNESGTIESTLINIVQQLNENGRLLVVADNCTDNTAQVASAHGAEVIERFDKERIGKGYALDFGIRHLVSNPPQVVIIIDADCVTEDGALELLASTAINEDRPVQALYLMEYNKPNLKQRIAEFAWRVKNYVRPRGLANIGLPCQLMGTGMAFPWSIISTANLATSNIVEDMKMGIDLATMGYAPFFCSEAVVTSTFPELSSAELSQRKRWEHGHLSLMSVLPGNMLHALLKRDKNLLAMTLDLLVPPITFLTLLTFAVFIITFALFLVGYSGTPLIVSTVSVSLLALSVFFAWLFWGRKIITFSDLLSVPFYIMSKIPIYIKYLFKRQKEWVRTNRD